MAIGEVRANTKSEAELKNTKKGQENNDKSPGCSPA